jgi:microcystin-dependent protein
MAINFPSSPSVNDTHVVADKTWTWNGAYWHLTQNTSNQFAQDGVPSNPVAGDFWFETDTGNFFVRYDGAWVEIGHATDFGTLMSDLDGDTLIQIEESSDEDIIRFDTGGSERMVINASGKVGIGTSTPVDGLEVDAGGTGSASAGVTATTTETNGNAHFRLKNDAHEWKLLLSGGDGDKFIIRDQTNTAMRLTIDTSGNVTIADDLDVGGTTNLDNVDIDGTINQDGVIGRIAPTGVVLPFAGGTIPAGWLLCAGTAVSRTTYANLFAVIGTTYGVGDGSTTFNLPDMQSRVPAGVNTSDSNFVSLNTTGGAATVTLTSSEMPSHTHTQNSHIHHIWHPSYGYIGNVSGTFGAVINRNAIGNNTTGLWTATATTATNQNTGGGGAHSNLQPYISLYYIIAT